jgi:hypothetical protein
MEEQVRFLDLNDLNDEQAFMIASSLATVVSALAAWNSVVTAVCTDITSNGGVDIQCVAYVFGAMSSKTINHSNSVCRTHRKLGIG